MRRAIVVLAALALIVAGGSLAFGTIPDANKMFFGCYTKSGALRLIDKDAGQECTKQETEVRWNERGPTGPTGAPGAAGVVNVGTWRLWDLPGTSEPQDKFLPTDNALHERLTFLTFTTTTAGSLVSVTMQGPPARVSSDVDDTSCMFQLRVDGLNDSGSADSSRSGDQGGLAAVLSMGQQTNVPLHISAYFEGLAPGSHVLTLWVAGFPGTTCYFNPGNFIIEVHIEEIS